MMSKESREASFVNQGLKNTARYPSDIAPSGRIKVGEAVLFANLFSVGKYHPVVSLLGIKGGHDACL